MDELGSKIAILNKIPIFQGMEVVQQRVLAKKMEQEHAFANHMVFDEGQIGDKLYVIVTGTVLVLKNHATYGWREVAELSDGDFFGEIALLRNVPRTARITTKSECSFLTLSKHEFIESYQHFPQQVCDNIQLVIKKRLEELWQLK